VTSSENTLTDDICHVGFTPLSSCHVLGNIDPKPVLGYAVLEVFAVEVNRVALKFEPEEPDELDQMAAKLKAIKVELRRRMHDRPGQTGAWLRKVVAGYYQYHAVPGNIETLNTFRQRVNRLWYQALARRSQRARKRWEALIPLFERWIPRPKVLHPYPDARFKRHSSFIRAVCVNALVRICAGGDQ
jgi:hypothetical protein